MLTHMEYPLSASSEYGPTTSYNQVVKLQLPVARLPDFGARFFEFAKLKPKIQQVVNSVYCAL